jgi:hypothetical protein
MDNVSTRLGDGGHPLMLNDPWRERHTTKVVDWPDLPLPETAAAQRRIRTLLILLALVGLVAMVVSYLAG